MKPAPDGFYHPKDEAEVSALVLEAAKAGLPVRVRGAAHSEHSAIYSTPRLQGHPDNAIDIMLDRMAEVTVDADTRTAILQGGCHFGLDPRDPTGRSTEANGLCPAFEAAGLALPTLGGVSHQTVAGFMATGSEGASMKHGFHEQVEALTLVDGMGRVHHLTRDDEAFYGVGVAMGLCGVVTSVTVRGVERFDIEGTEQSMPRDEAELDLFSDGSDGLSSFLAQQPYARILWWPQPRVDRLTIWKARAKQRCAGSVGVNPTELLGYQPYDAFPRVAGSRLPMQAAAGLALRAIGTWPAGVRFGLWRRSIERLLAPAYRAFVPSGPPRPFCEPWHRGLPLDDQMEERMMPVRFTELWVDSADAAELMCRLKNLFDTEGYAATGNFACEPYGAKRSPFWMSPGYGRDSVRVNVFWMSSNPGDPAEGPYRAIWDTARSLGPRLHWGKILDPHDVEHAHRFPLRDRFLELRARFDPQGRFLSDYWRGQLAIDGACIKTAAQPAPSPRRRPLFGLRPVELDFTQKAKAQFSADFITKASPQRVFELFRVDPRPWMPDMRAYVPLTIPSSGVGAVVDEVFPLFTVRVRTIAEVPGQRWTAAVDACNLPLAERMLQNVLIEPFEGGTRATWTVYYDPMPQIEGVEPVARAVFQRLFARFCRQAGQYLDKEAAH